MLKKLRIKFIVLIMGVVAIVLTAAFAAICYMDWSQSVSDANVALDGAIMKASGTYEIRAASGTGEPPENDDIQIDSMVVDGEGRIAAEGHFGESGGIRSIFPATKSGKSDVRPIPDMFTAVYKQDGDSFTFVQEASSAMYLPEITGDYAQELIERSDGSGMLGTSIYYLEKTVPEGRYVAMTYAGNVNHWQELAFMLALVGAAALVVFFLVSIAFSRWALRPVEQAWQQQQRFVADASHDLKTPISVILANTDIMLDEPDQSADERYRWLSSTRDEAESMRDLVQDMLLTASEDRPVVSEFADLSRIATKELLQFESVAFERNLNIESSIAEDVQVRGSESEMRRLVQILLDNACKYANEGGNICVLLSSAGSSVAKLSVSNTGSGIAEEDIAHVFDRFYRADLARTSHEGHGLGLSIARSIVEASGGEISVTSSDSLTTFAASLPQLS